MICIARVVLPKARGLPLAIQIPTWVERDLYESGKRGAQPWSRSAGREGGFLLLVTALNAQVPFLQPRKQQMAHELDEYVFLSLILAM